MDVAVHRTARKVLACLALASPLALLLPKRLCHKHPYPTGIQTLAVPRGHSESILDHGFRTQGSGQLRLMVDVTQ